MTLHSESLLVGVVAITYSTVPSVPSILYVNFAAYWISPRMKEKPYLSSQSRYGGSGLGLVICQRLAALMGGDIILESTLGAGTTMRLVAPLRVGNPDELRPDLDSASTASATSRPMPSREQSEQEGSLLLLGEDHPTNRTVLRQQLALIGFHVDLAQDGQEAYEHWLTGRYGLLLPISTCRASTGTSWRGESARASTKRGPRARRSSRSAPT
jgi:Histidine kinase-, DNA gyrase B-, and HSP90-like ATPase